MRHKSTELMEKIQTYVENYYKEYRHLPSTIDIADAVGIASLALLFISGAARLFYKYDKYEVKSYIQAGIVSGLIGVALFI